MKNGLAIAKDIWRSHPNYLGEKSVAIAHDELMRGMANIFCPGPSFYYVIDSPTLTLDIVSPEVSDFFGVNPKSFDLQMFVDSVHPDEMGFLLRCEDVVAHFLKNIIAPEKVGFYKIISSLRHVLPNGREATLLKQTLVTRCASNGALLKVLGVHTDISHITRSPLKTLTFIGLHGEPSYMEIDVFQHNVFDKFVPFQFEINTREFTKRELEIIRLVARGGTNKEIAEALNISVQTVQTHRKNILKKAPVRNSNELVEYCIRRSYL